MTTSLASELPSDILRLIFDLLDQPHVLSSAAVCREWRATAVLDRSYYRALSLVYPTEGGTSLDTLRRAAREAGQLQYRISLTIEVVWPCGPLADLVRVEEDLAPALRSAIPHLVRLDVEVDQDLEDQLLAALTVPAPLLSFLKVHVWVPRGLADCPLPGDLFSGHAPLLKDVSLVGIQLHAPTPCFENTVRLRLESPCRGRKLDEMVACFPRVRHVALCGLRRSLEDPVSPGAAVFFGRLLSLHTECHASSSALVPFLPSIARIPELELCTAGDVDALAWIMGAPAPDELVFSEHVEQYCGRHFSHLRVQLRAPAATRGIKSYVDYDVALRALRLSSAARSLTKVTIDDRHVRELTRACPSMPLLEHLSIVLVAWSAAVPWAPDRDIDCTCPVRPFYALDTRPPDETLAVDYPRLRTLELRATHARATVRADVLPALARCLGPLHLVLSNGAALDTGAAESAFSSIRRGSPAEFVPAADTARVAALFETAAQRPERIHSDQCPH